MWQIANPHSGIFNRFSLPQNFEERGHAQISWRIVLIIVNSVIASTSGQRITVALVWSWSEWAGATITFIFVQKKFWVGYWNDATMEFWHYQAIATRISKCNMEERLVSFWWSSCIKETFIPSRLHCIDWFSRLSRIIETIPYTSNRMWQMWQSIGCGNQ